MSVGILMGDMKNRTRLLLIEADTNIANVLAHALNGEYVVDVANSGRNGIYQHDAGVYETIVLDLSLPDVPGLIVCQQLRERGAKAPILILSAENRIVTKINLLDAGADDFLTKPFSLGELKARLRALSRRNAPTSSLPNKIEVGDLVLDMASHQVWRNGALVELRRKEFSLLTCLMQQAGTVVSREALVRHAWQGQEEPWKNTVDVHIKYLRDKLDRPFERQLIRTVHGFGYRLEAGVSSKVAEVA